MRAGVGIAGDEELVRSELGSAVEIDRAARLVGGKRHRAFHFLIDARVDQVHRAVDVRFHALERVVFGRRHDLRCRGMHHVLDAIERAVQALLVAYIADEEAHARVGAVGLRHLPLLHLVARVDDQPARLEAGEGHRQERVAEGPRPSGHEYGCAVQHLIPPPNLQILTEEPALDLGKR